MGCPSLLQGICSTQGSNLRLLHWQVDSLPSEPPGLVMCNWGKFWTKRHKETQSPTATFEELEARAGRRASPCSQHHKRAGRPPKPPSGQLPYTPLSSPRIRKQLIPLGGGTKGTCFCSRTPLLQQGPSKALPEFLVWPPVDFY